MYTSDWKMSIELLEYFVTGSWTIGSSSKIFKGNDSRKNEGSFYVLVNVC